MSFGCVLSSRILGVKDEMLKCARAESEDMVD